MMYTLTLDHLEAPETFASYEAARDAARAYLTDLGEAYVSVRPARALLGQRARWAVRLDADTVGYVVAD